VNALFDLSEILTDNLHPLVLISRIVRINLPSHPRVPCQVDKFPVRNPGEVDVGHDGSTPGGKLSTQIVGRTVDDRSVSRSTEPGKMSYVPVPVRMKVSEHDEIRF
jgi:hypothetical protein